MIKKGTIELAFYKNCKFCLYLELEQRVIEIEWVPPENQEVHPPSHKEHVNLLLNVSKNVTEQMAIDMELNDNVKRQLTDQRKECYEMFLFLMNQGFKRLLLWLNSGIMLVLAVI